MKVHEIMSTNVASCDKSTPIEDVARMMVEHDCGMIPVVEKNGELSVVGTVTDRDIACRIVAEGKTTRDCTAEQAMSTSPVCIEKNQPLSDAEELMTKHMIRRLVVVDSDGHFCGVLSQADIARHDSRADTGRLVSIISEPSSSSARKTN